MSFDQRAGKRPKALVFIDHDMIVRHFVLSGAFAEIERTFDVTYVFNDDTSTHKKWLTVDVHSLHLPRVLVTHIPRVRMGSWYKLYAITVLHLQRGTPNYLGRRERMADINGWPRTVYYDILSRYPIYPLVRRRLLKELGVYEPLSELIRSEAPDLLIQPTQLNGYYINELQLLSEKLGIPFLVLMNSWDNPSQKAAATGMPTKLAVWGEQTKDHAIRYMRLPPERISVLGAAQFDLYRTPVRESDDELRSQFGVPQGKPIVLYGGVSKSIDETRHLRLLEDGIRSGVIRDCHVLYRPHPWRGGLVEGEENFFDADFRHISMDPHMEPYYRRVVNRPEVAFDMADYEVTKKLLQLVSGTISTMSTIQLETALVGKPSISFMPTRDMETKYGKSTAIGFRLAHFQGLWECPGIEICPSDEGLPAAVNRLLDRAGDAALCDTIRNHARTMYVDLSGETYASKLRDLAASMVVQAA